LQGRCIWVFLVIFSLILWQHITMKGCHSVLIHIILYWRYFPLQISYCGFKGPIRCRSSFGLSSPIIKEKNDQSCVNTIFSLSVFLFRPCIYLISLIAFFPGVQHKFLISAFHFDISVDSLYLSGPRFWKYNKNLNL